jgi:hypothetical protein
MSDQVIVTNQEDLYVTVVGARVTEFPDTGVIVSMEKISPDAAIAGGLHRTAAISVNASDIYRLSITVHGGSVSNARFGAIRRATRKTGKVAGVTVTYKGTQYISGSCVVESTPVHNFNADSSEPRTWAFIGLFPVAIEVPIANAQTLAESDLEG